MLVIRDEQMRAFAAAQWRDFERLAAAHLAESFPEPCASLGPEGLAAMVQHGVERARLLGFESESEILRFLNLLMVFGYDLEQQEWVREILDHPGYSACTKMDLLTETGMMRSEGTADSR